MTVQDAGTVSTDAGATQTTADASTVLTAAAPVADSTKTAPAADGSTQATAPADDASKSTEGKPADDAAKGEAKPGDKPADDKPVEYAFKTPDGIELAQADVDAFTAIAREAKLPADVAQKVVDLAVQREQARMTEHTNQVKTWGETVAADKELGKAENLAAARSAIDRFGSAELKSLLNTSGFGNHPELVRFALKVGRAISEDGVHQGRGDAPTATDAAKVLYPNQA